MHSARPDPDCLLICTRTMFWSISWRMYRKIWMPRIIKFEASSSSDKNFLSRIVNSSIRGWIIFFYLIISFSCRKRNCKNVYTIHSPYKLCDNWKILILWKYNISSILKSFPFKNLKEHAVSKIRQIKNPFADKNSRKIFNTLQFTRSKGNNLSIYNYWQFIAKTINNVSGCRLPGPWIETRGSLRLVEEEE